MFKSILIIHWYIISLFHCQFLLKKKIIADSNLVMECKKSDPDQTLQCDLKVFETSAKDPSSLNSLMQWLSTVLKAKWLFKKNSWRCYLCKHYPFLAKLKLLAAKMLDDLRTLNLNWFVKKQSVIRFCY